MPISNYQIPGVYVTQTQTSLNTINPTAINVAIVADQATPAAQTDTFNGVIPTSGTTIGQLSKPMVVTTSTGTYTSYSGFTVTWLSSSGTTVTGTYGTNFNVITTSGQPYSLLTTSGITATGTNTLPSGTVNITYANNWGAYGTYYNYNQVYAAVGTAVSGSAIINPASLAAYLAFLNGANTVQIMPVARISGVTSANTSDWTRVFAVPPATSTSDVTLLSNFTGVDVIVPLYGFLDASNQPATSSVSSGIVNYLNSQFNYGIYQRVFAGVDGTAGQVTSNSMTALASGFNSTRVSLVFPGSINYNPGLNTTTGLTNTNFNIPGYYLAAALAGLFVGQPNVATPITNKKVAGFNNIPNQISINDAATNYLPNGITTVYQKRDGNFWVLQGLTTNVQNWLTQEISINAIGDQLSYNIYNDLNSGYLIGGPMTATTISSAKGGIISTLINAVATGLIQNYQNVVLSVAQSTPTTVNVTFQYAPTYPINYIQVTLSFNTQTGNVVQVNQQNSIATY